MAGRRPAKPRCAPPRSRPRRMNLRSACRRVTTRWSASAASRCPADSASASPLRAPCCGARRRAWRLAGPQMLGHIFHHVVQDPREPRRLVLAAKAGHLGPTVYTSIDRGRHWQEALTPPAFRKVAEGEKPRAVERVFWLTPGHSAEPGAWYAGSSPAGLFRSEDHGAHWQPVAGFNDHPMNPKWAAGLRTPDGELLHSVRVDPRDARHLYLAISIGGGVETTPGGAAWGPLHARARAR